MAPMSTKAPSKSPTKASGDASDHGSSFSSSRVPSSSYAPSSSRFPGASTFPSQSQRPPPMPSRFGATRLVRDEVSLGSRVPIRADDESMALAREMSSVRPDSRDSKQTMERVLSRAPVAIATKLNRDNNPISTISFIPSKTASRMPTQMAPSAPSIIPSILTCDYDKTMAQTQLNRDILPVEKQEEQDMWAIKKLSNSIGEACPDNHKWSRVEGGYLCGGLGHAVTDELVSEGRGGIMAVGKGQHVADVEERKEDNYADPPRPHRWGETEFPNYWGQWEKWEGPWYYSKDAKVGGGEERGAYILGDVAFRAADAH